jgi:Tfp pilus assembly protein PilN
VLRARRQVEERRATLAAVARLEGAREHWAGALATVSDALPEAAYLVSFAAAGAEIRLGGLAASGHEVIPALTAVPRFRGVTLTAPLRREPETGLERFDVRFSIARRQPGDARTAATRAPSGDGR